MKTTLMPGRFANRRHAGSLLAQELERFADRDDVLILALPRGGVPVAAEISAALGKPFDVLVVRKLGVPGHEEVAMGAIASGGLRVIDHEMIRMLGINETQLDAAIQRETAEIARRERLYRRGRPMPGVRGRTVIVVDDGVATGSTMSAAVALLRQLRANRIVVAVPVAPLESVGRLREEADEVVVLKEPYPFQAVGAWYDEFSQTSDEEVRALLDGCPSPHPEGEGKAQVLSPENNILGHINENSF